MNGISYSSTAPTALPLSGKMSIQTYIAPPAAEDTEDYLCGNAGPAFEGSNPGRDQDRSRVDERIPASFSYSSGGSDPITPDSPEGF